MQNAGAAGILAALGYKDWSQCSNGQVCFQASDPLQAIVGDNAGFYSGSVGQYPSGGLGSFCAVFLFEDLQGGWHYNSTGCAQNPGYLPGPQDHVNAGSSCANVHTDHTLASTVVACLATNTIVDVDSAPVYADGYIWWHLAGRGWMVNDLLIQPLAHA